VLLLGAILYVTMVRGKAPLPDESLPEGMSEITEPPPDVPSARVVKHDDD
jgi:hypothetical protein